MAQQEGTDHNSKADSILAEPGESIKHKKNVVGALLEHFKKWHPEKLTNASSIQEMRETSESQGQK